MKKYMYLLICFGSIVLLGLIVTPYIVTFGIELPRDTSHWGDFGAYIGGTIASLVGIATLVIIAIQLRAIIDQLSLQKSFREISSHKEIISEVFRGIDLITRERVDIPKFITNVNPKLKKEQVPIMSLLLCALEGDDTKVRLGQLNELYGDRYKSLAARIEFLIQESCRYSQKKEFVEVDSDFIFYHIAFVNSAVPVLCDSGYLKDETKEIIKALREKFNNKFKEPRRKEVEKELSSRSVTS